MNVVLPSLVRFFLAVAEISCEASILVLVVLAAQFLCGRRLQARWRNALWLLVLLRLVLPELPSSPFSVYRITPVVVVSALQDGMAPVVGVGGHAPSSVEPSSSRESSTNLVRAIQVGAMAWLAGMAALASTMAWSNWRFDRKLRRLGRPVAGERILRLARASADELGVRRSFSVVETELVGSPALFGLFRPRLLLPAGLEASLSDDELRLVLLHELAHMRRGDLYHHALLSVMQVVHWFNPLLWFAFGRMRDDREMAADALVLSGERTPLKICYGHTLLKLIERAPVSAAAVQLVGILENPDQLRHRLDRIKRATPDGNSWSRSGLAMVCLLGALFLTRAYGDARTLVIQAKVEDQPWNGWGLTSPIDQEADDSLPAEEFSLQTDSPTPRVFSGKVVMEGPLDGVQVGLVSLVRGVHWVNAGAFQWQPVNPDGTFSITDSNYLGAPKAIVMRGPATPWTFLRYNFAPDESATGIVLRAKPARTIQLSVSGADGRELPQSSFELFPAHVEYDDEGQALRRQRLGLFASGDATSVQVPVSLGEIAVFAHHAGYASYYQVIDTRDAERFRFVLQEPGSMRISVLDMGGQPKAGVAVWWVNRAAPLSISQTSTNGEGLVQQGDLTPGTFILRVGGFAPREIQVAENEETETIFREGIDP